MSLSRRLLVLCALAAGAAPLQAQRVTFERTGYRLSSIGERVMAVVRVLDSRGRPIPNVPVTFRIVDPSVATVSARGEMVARRVGNTFVWAIAGRDSASAIVLVEQLAAKFSFSPPTLRLDALGAKVPLKIQASDAAGNPLPGGATKASFCRSMNDRIAALAQATGEVTAIANGSTYIRCADRGIADSLRIEVLQRPAVATIAANLKRTQKEVGDTFTVKVVGRDRLQKEISDVRPTWASLSPSVVSVDPYTGKAQARDNGDAKIIVQIGDVADTATISVTGTKAATFQPTTADVGGGAAAGRDTTTASPIAAQPRTALFKVTVPDVFLGESSLLSVNARDSIGNPMPLGRLTFDRGYDTTVALLQRDRDSLKVIGRKVGTAQVIARLGAYIDTVLINVRVRPTTAAFHEPLRVLDSIAINNHNRDNIIAAIHFDSSSVRGQQSRLVLSASGVGLMVDHSTHPATNVVESRSGFITGGEGSMTLFHWLELSGNVGRGSLTPVASPTGVTVGEPLTLTIGEADLSAFPVSWLGISAGFGKRSETTPLATQSWTIPRFSVINRFGLVGDRFNTYTALSLMPGAKYTGTSSTDQPSTFSMSSEAGLEFHAGFYRLGVTYYVEQLKFATSTRVDQFSALRFRLGLSSGRN